MTHPNSVKKQTEYQSDGGKKADLFIAQATGINPRDQIRKVYERVQTVEDFDELKELILSALHAPNPAKSVIYGELTVAAFSQANLHSEVGRFHDLVETGADVVGVDHYVYEALLGKESNPEVIADYLEKISDRLGNSTRIMTLEKSPVATRNPRGQLLLMPFDIFNNEFITRSFKDGIPFTTIVESKSPFSILTLAADLAKDRTYKGDWGYDIDHFDSILEYAYCELMMLYLIPFSAMKDQADVRESLAKRGNQRALELFDSVIDFQNLIREELRTNGMKTLFPLVAMLRRNQITGFATIVRDEINEMNDRSVHAKLTEEINRKASSAKSGPKTRYELLLDLLQQSEYGLHYAFYFDHVEGEFDSSRLPSINLKADRQLALRLPELTTQLKKHEITIKDLPGKSIFAKEYDIDSISFSSDKEGIITAKLRSSLGAQYSLILSDEAGNEREAGEAYLLAYVKFILAQYDMKKKDISAVNVLMPATVMIHDLPATYIDMVDPADAHVDMVPVQKVLVDSGRYPVSGVILLRNGVRVYSVPLSEKQGVEASAVPFELELINAIYPKQELEPDGIAASQRRIISAVSLGDSAATVAAKRAEAQNKKKKKSESPADGETTLKGFEALEELRKRLNL